MQIQSSNTIASNCILNCLNYQNKILMSRKSRFRYKSRRERLQRDLTNMRIISIFAAIGLVIWIIMRREEIWWWLERMWFKIT